MRKHLSLILFAVLFATAAFAQVKKSDGIHIGSKGVDVWVDGNLYVNSPDGGSSSSVAGTSTNPNTLKVATLDAGSGMINGNLQILGKVPTLRTDVLDAGQIFAQGTGPITRILPFTTAAIDFASGTIVCADSAGTTVTGARTTDPCFVGMPTTLTAGGTGLHHNFSCYVSAADTIKVRACAAGTADDPGSVTFTGFVISFAQ